MPPQNKEQLWINTFVVGVAQLAEHLTANETYPDVTSGCSRISPVNERSEFHGMAHLVCFLDKALR
ncbi:MAG: hypothetical protein B1H08_05720 [Candidatus Omnitrophica bacterium 4484_171]|nr:MAG: hypothetical protein B1H08_05720 [Candidatus Omnitrophica bacterium 4484_171]